MRELKKEIRLWLISVLVLKIISLTEKLPKEYLNVKLWALRFPTDLIKNPLA